LRIAYLAQWDTHREDGVLKKIARQVRAWQDAGHEVVFFALTRDSHLAPCLDGLDVQTTLLRTKLDLFWVPTKTSANILPWKPDVVYTRFNKYFPALQKLAARNPLIVEINTNDLEEFRFTTGRVIYLYHRLTRDILLKKCSAMVFLAEETALHFSRYHKPYVIIGDSITLDSYPIPHPNNNDSPRLVFMASHPSVWQGVDKLLLAANHFRDWQFDLIGLGEHELPAKAPSNLTAHGYLKRVDYEKILAASDVAIGPLALHRIGIHDNAPLKLREYLACGLPCIIAHEDTDFPGGAPFLLQLPNTENNVIDSRHDIEAFVSNWKGKRVDRHAISHLDVKIKEKQRLEFFHAVLGEKA
jgi:glycosyltransferase involved in cell wall biosynthesis